MMGTEFKHFPQNTLFKIWVCADFGILFHLSLASFVKSSDGRISTIFLLFTLVIICIQIHLEFTKEAIKILLKLSTLCMIGLSGDITLNLLNVIKREIEYNSFSLNNCKSSEEVNYYLTISFQLVGVEI